MRMDVAILCGAPTKLPIVKSGSQDDGTAALLLALCNLLNHEIRHGTVLQVAYTQPGILLFSLKPLNILIGFQCSSYMIIIIC